MSQHAGDAHAQTGETIVSLLAVIADAHKHGLIDDTACRDRLFKAFGPVPSIVYLQADICRQELLLEIEVVCSMSPPDRTLSPAPMSIPRLASVLLALIAIAPCGVRGGEFPLWEAGVGAAVIDFPDYRGADERRVLALPIPYFVYRGELLKADRGGLRGEFFRNDRVDLHLSVNGSIPVDSSDNATRRGMPDLDPTLEIGPRLDLKLLRDADRGLEVTLGLPARTVIASDFSHSKNIGWVFQPQINIDFRDTWLGEGWHVGFAAGPLFGDRRYHNYFYGVPPAFATPQRPAYNAPGGYAGSQFLGAASKRFRSFWVGGFVRLDTLADAVFEASPLVRQNETFAAGFAIAWILGSSQKMVEAEE